MCKGRLAVKGSIYECQNITDQEYCVECVNKVMIVDDFRQRCLGVKKQFRCPNNTTNKNKMCSNCCFGGYPKNNILIKAGDKKDDRQFKLYLRSFDWNQKVLNALFAGLNKKQKVDLFLYNKFFISELNLKYIISEYEILERYFLIKQLVVTDLIFSLMFPQFIYRSMKMIWNKYFSERYYDVEDYDKCVNNIINYKLPDEACLDYLSEEGYKTFYDDQEYVDHLIEKLNNVNLSFVTKTRTKNFIYALTEIDL